MRHIRGQPLLSHLVAVVLFSVFSVIWYLKRSLHASMVSLAGQLWWWQLLFWLLVAVSLLLLLLVNQLDPGSIPPSVTPGKDPPALYAVAHVVHLMTSWLLHSGYNLQRSCSCFHRSAVPHESPSCQNLECTALSCWVQPGAACLCACVATPKKDQKKRVRICLPPWHADQLIEELDAGRVQLEHNGPIQKSARGIWMRYDFDAGGLGEVVQVQS